LVDGATYTCENDVKVIPGWTVCHTGVSWALLALIGSIQIIICPKFIRIPAAELVDLQSQMDLQSRCRCSDGGRRVIINTTDLPHHLSTANPWKEGRDDQKGKKRPWRTT
jgi:hypothetical protein